MEKIHRSDSTTARVSMSVSESGSSSSPSSSSCSNSSTYSLTHLVIKLVLTQTSHYHQVISQCLRNTNTRCSISESSSIKFQANETIYCHRKKSSTLVNKPLARLFKWKSIVTAHDRFTIGFYLFILLKYQLLSLIAPGSLLDNYQYLDCFLVGRYKFIGRTNRCSGNIVSIFVLLFGIYRIIVIYFEPKFRFYAIEFLLNDFKDLQSNETVRMDSSASDGDGIKRTLNRRYVPMISLDALAEYEGMHVVKSRIDSICYLRSRFDPKNNEWILRPNRTVASWLLLDKYAKILTIMTLTSLICSLSIIFYMICGSVLSDLGFEMSYSTCVAWLRDRQAANNNNNNNSKYANYSYIYVAPKVIASEMRIDDLPARIKITTDGMQQVTSYTIIRGMADIIENCLAYGEFFCAFTASFYLLAIHSIDILINGNCIRAQLLDLLDRLETQQPQVFDSGSGHDDYNDHPVARNQYQSMPMMKSIMVLRTRDGITNQRRCSIPLPSWGLSSELARIQATLLDHFELTMAYNKFMSFFFLFLFSCWLCYTVVVCIWMGSIRSRAIEIEFVIAEAGVTFLAILLIATAAAVRSKNAKLYPLMAQFMAKETIGSRSKLRWMKLIRYYYPKSLYCFTMYGTNEISWLYCLKVVSWILSAFVVLASFFYMNRS